MKILPLKIRTFTVLTLFILINGCAQKASLKTTYSGNAENKMSHILVLALGKKDRSSSGQFENDVVSAIEKQGVKATSYLSVNKGIGPVNEETVKALVKKLGASGVLVTQLKSIEYDTDIKDGRKEIIRTPTNFDSFGDFFRSYEFRKIQNPQEVSLSASVKVSADLYSTTNGKIVWSGESTTVQRENASEVMADLSNSIGKGLKDNKLL